MTGATRCLFLGPSSSTLLLLEGLSGANSDESSAMEKSTQATRAPSLTHEGVGEKVRLSSRFARNEIRDCKPADRRLSPA